MDVLPIRPVSGTAPAETGKPNFAGLDALRSLAALGVVLLHSCVPYLRNPMPGLSWSVHDTPHTAIDILFWWIELFIMPLFLVLAGFFAWQTLQRRGPKTLFKNRARRLLIPLLFGVIVILPLDLYCWVGSWVAEGIVAPVKLRSLKFDDGVSQNLWGLSHLWFLQYLFLYVAGLAIFAVVRQRYPSIKRFQPSLKASIGLTLVAATCILCFDPQVVWGFQHSFLPVPAKWLYSGVFFALGLMLAIHDGKLHWLSKHATRMLAPAAISCIAALLLGRWQLHQWEISPSRLNQAGPEMATVLLATLTASSAILTTLSTIGLAVKSIDRIPKAISYLAAASFWIYIVHHPILGLTQLDLKLLFPGISPLLKVTLCFATACCLSLLTYESLVRTTAFGRLLGFQWNWTKPTVDDSEVQVYPVRTVAPTEHTGDSQTAPRRAA